jgi:predicted acylesterase/phospholipase RssA
VTGAHENEIHEEDVAELRLALVLNGGVSLAVWMGGVTQELDLLRRASNRNIEPSDEEREVFEIWRELTSGRRVVIDVIAGTSAGGLNGVLLATAIARGASLPPLLETWRKAADVGTLMDGSDYNTVLNGSVIDQEMKTALDTIRPLGLPTNPVTLFVTATALDGDCRAFKDSYDDQFGVRDHRRIYRFRHDPDIVGYRKYGKEWREVVSESGINDFEGPAMPGAGRMQRLTLKRQGPPEENTDAEDNTAALVLAARATASFPGAFSPVNDRDLVTRSHRVHPSSREVRASYVMDGGVLNNAPFGPVLDAITQRQLHGPVERVVAYIVPSAAEEAEQAPGQECGDMPPKEVFLHAVRYSGEINFRSGAEELDDRIKGSIRDIRQEVFRRIWECSSERDSLTEAASSILDHYRRRRAWAGVWEVRRRIADAGSVTELVAAPDTADPAIKEILQGKRNWIPASDALSRPAASDWGWGLMPAVRSIHVLRTHLHELLQDKDRREELSAEQRRALARAAGAITDQLRRAMTLTETVRMQLHEQRPHGGVLSPEEAADHLCGVFQDMSIPEKVHDMITKSLDEFLGAMRIINPSIREAANDALSCCLVTEVLTQSFVPPTEILRPLTPKFSFLRIGPDFLGPLFHEDRFRHLGARKLYGLRLQHFGAFLEEDWRKSDFVWGRLDAAHHLIRLLVKGERERADAEERLHEAILRSETPDSPQVRRSHLDWMERNLEELSAPDNTLVTHEKRKILDTLTQKAFFAANGVGPVPEGHYWSRDRRKHRRIRRRARLYWAATWPVRRRMWATYTRGGSRDRT